MVQVLKKNISVQTYITYTFRMFWKHICMHSASLFNPVWKIQILLTKPQILYYRPLHTALINQRYEVFQNILDVMVTLPDAYARINAYNFHHQVSNSPLIREKLWIFSRVFDWWHAFSHFFSLAISEENMTVLSQCPCCCHAKTLTFSGISNIN